MTARRPAGRLARSGLEAVDELRLRGVQIADLEHIAIDDPPRLLARPWTPDRDRLIVQLERLFAAAVLFPRVGRRCPCGSPASSFRVSPDPRARVLARGRRYVDPEVRVATRATDLRPTAGGAGGRPGGRPGGRR